MIQALDSVQGPQRYYANESVDRSSCANRQADLIGYARLVESANRRAEIIFQQSIAACEWLPDGEEAIAN